MRRNNNATLSVTELRTNTSAVLARVRRTKKPLTVTQRGRSTAVILNAEEYERQQERMALLEDIAEARRDIAEGRVYTQEEVERQLKAWLNEKGEV